jgi:4-alpha-glucanotransferase
MADNAIIGEPVEHDEDIDRLSCWYDNIDIADIVVERMIDNAMHSNAIICIIPLQDCLHLGSDARMNMPGTINGNWQWRFQWSEIELGHDSARINKMRLRNEHTQRFIEPDS